MASKGEMWVPLGSISNSFHIYHSHICSFDVLLGPVWFFLQRKFKDAQEDCDSGVYSQCKCVYIEIYA